MLLNSVIILLREVLEASLLISILLAFSRALGLSCRWIVWALACGMVGAITYSIGISTVSDWFDGVGQEVINACLQILIYLLLLFLTILVSWRHKFTRPTDDLITLVMASVAAVAIMREGVEVLVYLYGFSTTLPHLLTVMTGAGIGTGIGLSVGALVYYFLVSLQPRWSLTLGAGMLALVAAGMLSQAVLLLIQADWLPSQLPLWDSSSLLSENSVPGQLLYALIGYEATPTAIQAGFYFGGLLLLLVLTAFSEKNWRSS